jgi:hypothetical protein
MEDQMKKLLLLFPIMFGLVSCDADKELDKAFASNGLARINAPRTDFAPGAVILKGKKLTISAGSISDYVETASLTIKAQDRTNDVDAILPKLAVAKNINPSLAAGFIASAIPINGSLNLKFTSNVNVDQMTCKVSSIKIADLIKFLKDPKNSALAPALADFAKEHADIYIVYEVWKASTMNFSSTTGDNIDAEVKIGEVKPLLTSADAKFSYSKTSEKSLKITGDQFYPFALRLAKLQINPQTKALNVTFTDFKMNMDVKAVADESYSALPNGEAPLSVSAVSKDQIAAALRSE